MLGVVHTPPLGRPWDIVRSAGHVSHVAFALEGHGRFFQAACGRRVRNPDLVTTLLVDVDAAAPRWLSRPSCKMCQQRMPEVPT